MFILRMFFLWWVFLWKLWRVNAYARRHKRDKTYYTLQQRNDYLLRNARFFLWMYNIKVKVENYDSLIKSPAMITPNHKSNIDAIVILVALAKKTQEQGVLNKIPTFLAKGELEEKRITRNVLSILDTFFVDKNDFRKSLENITKFGNFVKENHTYAVVFPEGTRVKEDKIGEFKNGAFKVAISQYLPIIPTVISDTRDALNKKRFKKLTITVKFLNAIKPAAFMGMEANAIGDKVRAQIEREWNNGQETR